MMLTMRAGVEKCAQGPAEDATAGQVAALVADGAFWEARGNSGVILSQFFKGIAQGLNGKEVCAGADLAQASGQPPRPLTAPWATRWKARC
jgi:dihydroxyacetone kinase-like predicted kinase